MAAIVLGDGARAGGRGRGREGAGGEHAELGEEFLGINPERVGELPGHLGPYEIPATVLHSPSHLAQPFALLRSYAAGCFLCTDLQARVVHKNINPHQDTTTLPAALAIGVGRCGLSRRRELRIDGVLGSTHGPGPMLIIPTDALWLSWSGLSGERLRVPQDLLRSASKY